jgi:hypothetical protein
LFDTIVAPPEVITEFRRLAVADARLQGLAFSGVVWPTG